MNELHNTIYDLENLLLTPEVRSSFEQLNNLLAEDFKEFGSSGSIYNKQNVLERLTSNTDKVVYEMTEFSVIAISENVAFSTFKTGRIINDTEKTFSLRSALWRKEGSQWRMFFHQGTPVK